MKFRWRGSNDSEFGWGSICGYSNHRQLLYASKAISSRGVGASLQNSLRACVYRVNDTDENLQTRNARVIRLRGPTIRYQSNSLSTTISFKIWISVVRIITTITCAQIDRIIKIIFQINKSTKRVLEKRLVLETQSHRDDNSDEEYICTRDERGIGRERERESNCVLLRHNVHYSLSEDTDRDHVFAFHRFSPENRGVKFSTMDKFQSIYPG